MKNEPRPHYIWRSMRDRCRNPNYHGWKDYGGRGITICNRWLNFNNFWNDMKDGYSDELQIERINNNKGYYKSNCRWATRKEQGRNKRNNRYIKSDSGEFVLSEAAELKALHPATVHWRISNGWPADKLLVKPREYKPHDNRTHLIETPKGVMSVAEAERLYGISESLLRWRHKKNWPIEKMFQKPRER